MFGLFIQALNRGFNQSMQSPKLKFVRVSQVNFLQTSYQATPSALILVYYYLVLVEVNAHK